MRKTSFLVVFVLIAGAAWAQEPAKPEQQPKPEEKKSDTGIKASFKDGLRFKSDDGNFEAHIGGRYQENVRIVEDFPGAMSGSTGTFPRRSGFYSRAARLEMDGTLYKHWEFKVQADFSGGTALRDGFVGFKRWKEISFRLGQFKEPFSNEQLSSLLFLPMPERVTGDRLVPSRDIGFMIHGKLFDGIFGYQAAYYNGEGQNRSALADVEQDKDAAFRIELWPLKTSDSEFKGLRFGAATTIGRHDHTATFPDIRTRQSETRVIDMDGTTVVDGGVHRWGFEFQLPYDTFGIEAEWFRVTEELSEGAVNDDIDFTQWYVTLVWMATGEPFKFGQRPRPARNLLDEGGTGAIQLAFRYGRFDADPALVTRGFVDPRTATSNTTTTGVDEWSFAVNWWPVPNVRVTACFVRNEYDDNLRGVDESVDGESVGLMRFQVDF